MTKVKSYYHNEQAGIAIYKEDCLKIMRQFADKSFSLCLTDPPYNIGKSKEWDKWKKQDDYINWCGQWILECQRVLKDNGSFYFFHNDMSQITMLMEWIRKNSKFIFNSFIIWDKGDFRALAWKNPSEKSNLRSWFNTCEYCLFYTFQDKTGLTTVMLDTNNFLTLRQYFKEYQEALGKSIKQINTILGHRKAEHCFYWKTTQWEFPTKETYTELAKIPLKNKFIRQEYENIRQEYENLRQEYESLRYTFNLQGNDKNIMQTSIRNDGTQHIAQKPVYLIENIIKHSSNKDDSILDPFMGSGTTLVAACKLNRRAVGIERSEANCHIAVQRLENIQLYLPRVWN